MSSNNISSVVSGPAGPEAGVWVMEATTDLPSRFARSVVTDDQGRYGVHRPAEGSVPGVGARRWGLVDSPKVADKPGDKLNLGRRAGAERGGGGQYYPAIC